MISFEEATREVSSRCKPLGAESVPLTAAHQRVLASPIRAMRDQPASDVSMMDGYALRATDAAAPLRVVGEVAAGSAPFARALEAGEAVRIFTGAPVPAGADAVVMQERCVRGGDSIRVEEAVKAGQHIRQRGEELTAGSTVLPAGTVFDAAQVALAAACGVASVDVFRRPRVAILTTGNELVPVGTEPPPGKLVETNSLSLAALCTDAGALPLRLGLAGDDVALIADKLRSADADVLVTTGGASVGDHDHTEEALRALGGELVFHRVAIRPGKPVLFGTTAKGQLVFGLPGNPAAATLGFELFARLAIRMLQGDPRPQRTRLRAELSAPLKQVPGLTYFPRGRLSTALVFEPYGQQSSMQIGSWANANAVAVLPPGDERLKPGAEIDVLLTGTLR